MTGRVYRKQRRKSSYVSKGTGFGNARKRKPPKQLTEKQKLYRQTKQQVDIVNKRLRNLEKGGFTGTWASGKLINRLNVKKLKGKKLLTTKGITRIKISKDLSTTNLIAINQATRQFLESKTSTSRGIKETRKSVIKSLQKTFGDMNYEINYKQAELMYNLFDETDFEDVSRYSNASVVWTVLTGYIKKEINEETLLDQLQRYGNVDYNNDKDLRDKVNEMIKYLKTNR